MKKPKFASGSFQIAVLILFSIIACADSKRSVVLEKQVDLFRMWKLNGNYIYFPNGQSLRSVRAKFPTDFDFQPFLMSKGIWSVFPESLDERFIQNTTTSFVYSSSAQLLDSVTITYCMAGNSRISVRKYTSDPPFFTAMPSETPAYEWVEISTPFPGASQFTVQASIESSINGDTSFILIDRIEGFYSEATTRSTSPRPKAMNIYSSQTGGGASVATAGSVSTFLLSGYLSLSL